MERTFGEWVACECGAAGCPEAIGITRTTTRQGVQAYLIRIRTEEGRVEGVVVTRRTLLRMIREAE